MTRAYKKLVVTILIIFAHASVPSAEIVRVGYPSLATGFAPSWVTSDKGIWKKQGLDVELVFLRGGSRTVAALMAAASTSCSARTLE